MGIWSITIYGFIVSCMKVSIIDTKISIYESVLIYSIYVILPIKILIFLVKYSKWKFPYNLIFAI